MWYIFAFIGAVLVVVTLVVLVVVAGTAAGLVDAASTIRDDAPVSVLWPWLLP